jgi:hypothetical protein
MEHAADDSASTSAADSAASGDVTADAGPGAGAEPPTAATDQRRSASRPHRILVTTLVWATTVLAVLGIFSVWANRQVLNPDNWANTSTQLLQNDKVRTALSAYLVNQLYANVNVQQELASRLPSQLQPLAGPVSGALRNVATSAAQRLLANPQVQDLWRAVNRAADKALVAIVNGQKGVATVNNGEVTLNLAAVVSALAQQLGLPDVSSKLPPSVATLVVLKSNQLKSVQDGGQALKGLALLLTILVPVLYALAIFLAKGWRRQTLMRVGFAIMLAGVIVFLGRTLIVSGVTNSLVKIQSNKPAAHAVLTIATSTLVEIAGAFVIVGIPLMLAAWFAGPSRWATRARHAIAPVMLEHAAWAFGAVAFALALIFLWGPIPATHRPAGIIVFTVLAMFGTEVLRRQITEEAAATPRISENPL